MQELVSKSASAFLTFSCSFCYWWTTDEQQDETGASTQTWKTYGSVDIEF